MPVDLGILLSANPPFYGFSAFIDKHYSRFTTENYDNDDDDCCSLSEKNFINDHRFASHLHYPVIGRSIDASDALGIQYRDSTTIEKASKSQVNCCSLFQREVKGFREKKRVSFADDKGLALVEVRSIPCNQKTTTKCSHGCFSLLSSGIKPFIVPNSEREWKTCNVTKPSPSTFKDRLQENFVALEKFEVEGSEDKDSLRGTIKVRNLAYKKEVFLRITFDRWATFEDFPAVYREPKNGEKGADDFDFSLSIPSSALRYEVVEFCICYRANDHEYWDNNGGVNYRLIAVAAGRKHKTSLQISEILSNKSGDITPRYSNTSERLRVFRTIDSWDTLIGEQPYW